MIRLKLNFDKIDQSRLFTGKSGRYLDITVLDRADSYGNEFMVVQDLGKEARERGEKGPILGNGKTVGPKPAPSGQNNYAQPKGPPKRTYTPAQPPTDRPRYSKHASEDVPF